MRIRERIGIKYTRRHRDNMNTKERVQKETENYYEYERKGTQRDREII